MKQEEALVEIEKDQDEGPILNVREAARLMKCSAAVVYRDCELGTMPCIRKGKRILFKKTDLLTWLDGMRTGPEVVT